MGDLQTEFSSAPEKGEELPLDELGAALNVGYAGTLGKHTSGLVSRMVAGKLPGGFSITTARGHISKTWGLGPLRTDGALLHGITLEPPKRLGSEPEAKAWLDSVVASYAAHNGVTLSTGGGAAGGGGGGGGGAVMNSEAFDKYVAEQEDFTSRQVDLLMRHLKKDPRAGNILAEKAAADAEALQTRLDAINREHGEFGLVFRELLLTVSGDSYVDGIMPIFTPLKARTFDSSFNWSKQEALSMFYALLSGDLDPSVLTKPT